MTSTSDASLVNLSRQDYGSSGQGKSRSSLHYSRDAGKTHGKAYFRKSIHDVYPWCGRVWWKTRRQRHVHWSLIFSTLGLTIYCVALADRGAATAPNTPPNRAPDAMLVEQTSPS